MYRSALLCAALAIWLTGTLASAQTAALSPATARLLEEAGNTEDERVRLGALEKLSALPLEEALAVEAKNLAAFVRLWNPTSGRLNFFIRESAVPGPGMAMDREARTAFKDYDLKVRADSPLRPLAELYRGRIFAWYLLEQGNLRTNPPLAVQYKNEALRSFRAVEKAFPQNRIPSMYQGTALPWPKTYPPVTGAPPWAVLQREHLDRFRDIIHWWIDHRQQADGAFGGGWGDDCEMRRWWAPLLFGFDDPKISAAQVRFSTASLARPEMKDGFLGQVRDVEHSAEDTTDNLVPLLLLQPAEPRWQVASQRLTDLLHRVWTARNECGELQFRSFYFSATEVGPAREHAYDVIGNVLALVPALAVWETTHDPKLGGSLTAWLDTWVAATARAENGKPAGILPAALRWPDGKVTGADDHWWEPLPSNDSSAKWYIWPSVLNEMTDAFLTAHRVTGDARYLAPIRSMAAIRLKYLKNMPAEAPAPGTEAWCAAGLGPRPSAHNTHFGSLVRTLVKCRTFTGTREFDELIALDGGDNLSRRDEGSRKAVVKELTTSLELLRQNFPSFTSEVRYTDRVLSFPRFLALNSSSDGFTGVLIPQHDLLCRMVGGDTSSGRMPMPAVRWRTSPQDLAVWVTVADHLQLEAELFHFGTQPRPLSAELRLLVPGRYRVELLHEGRGIGPALEPVNVKTPLASVHFELPSQKLCVLRITPAEAPRR